jgi:hypothetical protein
MNCKLQVASPRKVPWMRLERGGSELDPSILNESGGIEASILALSLTITGGARSYKERSAVQIALSVIQ